MSMKRAVGMTGVDWSDEQFSYGYAGIYVPSLFSSRTKSRASDDFVRKSNPHNRLLK